LTICLNRTVLRTVGYAGKEALYHAYNMDRGQQQKEVWDIVNTLGFCTLDSAWPTLSGPYRASSFTAVYAAIKQICKALRTLLNPTVLKHKLGSLYNKGWAL
jgi:phage terminase large subunit